MHIFSKSLGCLNDLNPLRNHVKNKVDKFSPNFLVTF